MTQLLDQSRVTATWPIMGDSLWATSSIPHEYLELDLVLPPEVCRNVVPELVFKEKSGDKNVQVFKFQSLKNTIWVLYHTLNPEIKSHLYCLNLLLGMWSVILRYLPESQKNNNCSVVFFLSCRYLTSVSRLLIHTIQASAFSKRSQSSYMMTSLHGTVTDSLFFLHFSSSP